MSVTHIVVYILSCNGDMLYLFIVQLYFTVTHACLAVYCHVTRLVDGVSKETGSCRQI